MKKTLRRILIFFCLAVLCVITAFVAMGYSMYRTAVADKPPVELIESIRSGSDYVTIDTLPDMYKEAVVAVEDRRFYSHRGIDLISIGRAVWTDIKNMKFVEGGSTITQQLAKNLFFTQKRLITRKVAEVFMAFWLERNYDKDEILELYVNTIYFGSGYYSVRAASLGYFDKEPSELSDYESTMLAGLPNAPSVYSPDSNPVLASQRQKQVISKLVKNGYITKEQGGLIAENAA